jgi:excisionase family DNA binding protein
VTDRGVARKPRPAPLPLNERVGQLRPPAPRLERRTYTVREAAQVLGVGKNLMYDAIRSGRVQVIRLGDGGRKIVIPREAIERLLEIGTDVQKQ